MNVAFTICSNNYLAHAATLMESWFQYHPDSLAYVVLVDELNEGVNYEILKPAQIVQVKELQISIFDTLVEEYNITELNTAVKPDAFMYLFEKHPGSKILYIDPDILVAGEFTEVLHELNDNDFVLTPHICSPIDDDKAPTDYHTLRTGIFNLGFIGLKQSKQINEFLYWWRDRVYKYGYVNFSASMFYDQIWTNYIPVFYDKYCILKHLGYNVANWNLHERVLEQEPNDSKWLINEKYELKFFHFSSYKFLQPETICSYNTRYNFDNRPDLLPIFQLYHNKLLKFGANKLKDIPCVFYENHKLLKAKKESEKVTQLIAAHKALPFRIKLLKKIITITSSIANSYQR